MCDLSEMNYLLILIILIEVYS